MVLPHGEFRMFDKPDYTNGRPGDAAWYANREVSDHIHEPGHRERLLQAAELIQSVLPLTNEGTVADYACGNGGLLHELKKLSMDAFGIRYEPFGGQMGKGEIRS